MSSDNMNTNEFFITIIISSDSKCELFGGQVAYTSS